LTPRKVGKSAVFCVRHLAEKYALDHPEHVYGRKNNAGSGKHGRYVIPVGAVYRTKNARFEHTEHDQKFTDETIQKRQTDRRHRRENKDGRIDRHNISEPAELGDSARVTTLVDKSNKQKQRAGRDAVI